MKLIIILFCLIQSVHAKSYYECSHDVKIVYSYWKGIKVLSPKQYLWLNGDGVRFVDTTCNGDFCFGIYIDARPTDKRPYMSFSCEEV